MEMTWKKMGGNASLSEYSFSYISEFWKHVDVLHMHDSPTLPHSMEHFEHPGIQLTFPAHKVGAQQSWPERKLSAKIGQMIYVFHGFVQYSVSCTSRGQRPF